VKRHTLGVTFLLLSAPTMGLVLFAQSPQGQPSVADAVKAIDALVEKNRQLERQNQELINQPRRGNLWVTASVSERSW
jgi:hypothetical protein